MTLSVPTKLIIVFGIMVLIAMIVFAGYAAWSPKGSGIACTMEAKICPNGSAVGRTGPKCEFAECPSETIGEFWGVIMGTVTLGPTCPVEMVPPDPNCADKPYATTLVVTTADQSEVIREFSSLADGTFYLEVPPGRYVIRSSVAANILPYCSSNDWFEVKPNDSALVTVSCDTGIR